MNKQKIIGLIVGIVLFIAAIAGLTYAYTSWTSDNMNKIVSSKCFNVLYDKGKDFIGDINPSVDYTGGISVTVKMDIDSTCDINAKGKIYLTVDDTTSENLYTEGLLNYQVLKNGIVTNLKGSITSSGDIVIDVGFLNKNTVATTTYTIYVWINGDYVTNEHARSSFSGSVRTEAVQTSGMISTSLIDHITNLYINANKTTVTNNSITYNYATSVSLMNDRLGGTTTSLDGGNIRYYGANPNNYIDIGDVYTEDTIIDNYEKNSFALSYSFMNLGISDSKSCYSTLDCSVNYSNLGFGDVTTCKTTLENQYGITNVDDVCGTTTKKAGDPKLYRVIGMFKDVEKQDGTTQDLVKVIREDSIGNLAWDLKGTSESNEYYDNNWHDSTLKTILNGAYYNGGSTTHSYYNLITGSYNFGNIINFKNSGLNSAVHNKIETVVWNLGGWDDSDIYSNEIYGYERGNSKCTDCTYDTTWPGKIALAYPSDIGYAADFTKCSETLVNYTNCFTSDWMRSFINGNAYEWLITPDSGYSSGAWAVFGGSFDANNDNIRSFGVRPVFYLDPELGIVSGDGSKSNPYRIQSNSNIDTTAPICALSVNSDNTVSFAAKSDDVKVKEYGLSNSSTATYNGNNSIDIENGTIYGYVKDAAGNSGSCSVTINTSNEKFVTENIACDLDNYNSVEAVCYDKGLSYNNSNCSSTPIKWKKNTFLCSKGDTITIHCAYSGDDQITGSYTITEEQYNDWYDNNYYEDICSNYHEEGATTVREEWSYQWTSNGFDYVTSYNSCSAGSKPTCDSSISGTSYYQCLEYDWSVTGNITCDGFLHTCDTGYTLLNDNYCYKYN